MFYIICLLFWSHQSQWFFWIGFLIIVYFLLGISPASNCSWPTFRNPVSVPSSEAGCTVWRWNWYRVPKRRPTTIWRRGNTQKKIYNIQITANVWNKEGFLTIDKLHRPGCNRTQGTFQSSNMLLNLVLSDHKICTLSNMAETASGGRLQ